MAKIKVLLVDDHELVRAGMRQLIGAQTDMVVVGDRLFVLLRATAVIALTTADPAHPRIVARAGADELRRACLGRMLGEREQRSIQLS